MQSHTLNDIRSKITANGEAYTCTTNICSCRTIPHIYSPVFWTTRAYFPETLYRFVRFSSSFKIVRCIRNLVYVSFCPAVSFFSKRIGTSSVLRVANTDDEGRADVDGCCERLASGASRLVMCAVFSRVILCNALTRLRVTTHSVFLSPVENNSEFREKISHVTGKKRRVRDRCTSETTNAERRILSEMSSVSFHDTLLCSFS